MVPFRVLFISYEGHTMIDEFSAIYTVHITLNIQLLISKVMHSTKYDKITVDGGIIIIVQSYTH